MTDNVYTVTPRLAKELIIDILEGGCVPFLQSSPGMGKSALMASVAQHLGLYMIDHRLSTSLPEDLNGMPDLSGPKAVFKPFDIFPVLGDEVPKGYEGFMLFFDEMNSATRNVQAAAYKPILDRFLGQTKLHEKCIVTSAGNLQTDKAIVNALSTAMKSRVITLKMELNFDEFMEDVAIPQQWDGREIAYLSYRGLGSLMNFNPAVDTDTFACPRTWDFMQKIIKGKEIVEYKLPMYAGTVGDGEALDFVNFSKIYQDLPKFEDILREPNSTPVPTATNLKWATVVHVVERTKKENFDKVHIYIDRFAEDFQVLCYRMLMKYQPGLRTHPLFAKVMVGLGHKVYNNGTA